MSIVWIRSLGKTCLALAAAGMMLTMLCGCWARKHAGDKAAVSQQKSDQGSTADNEEAQEPTPEPTAAPPSVTVHLSYAHKGDYLQSLAVAKFASAALLPSHGEKAGASLVRFEGGEPVWEIAADRGVSGSLLGHMPGVKENKKFALTEVTYGVVPKRFSREQPENSDPEPLEPGKYYIFTVKRASGTTDYQAVHITEDGTIESYDAQPRVGTSYLLCCDVAPDFASPAPDESLSSPGAPAP